MKGKKKTVQVLQYGCLLAPDAGLLWIWKLSKLLEACLLLAIMMENHIIVIIPCVLLMRSNKSTDCYHFHGGIINTNTISSRVADGQRDRPYSPFSSTRYL